VKQLYAAPMHPYTLALLSAVPVPDPNVEDARTRIVLEGDLPSPANPPSGCRFRTRCVYARDRCADERPGLRSLESGHEVACHFAEEIAVQLRR
jgi:oligopeptide/dipeptide ABC transporter ATP-binding protein